MASRPDRPSKAWAPAIGVSASSKGISNCSNSDLGLSQLSGNSPNCRKRAPANEPPLPFRPPNPGEPKPRFRHRLEHDTTVRSPCGCFPRQLQSNSTRLLRVVVHLEYHSLLLRPKQTRTVCSEAGINEALGQAINAPNS